MTKAAYCRYAALNIFAQIWESRYCSRPTFMMGLSMQKYAALFMPHCPESDDDMVNTIMSTLLSVVRSTRFHVSSRSVPLARSTSTVGGLYTSVVSGDVELAPVVGGEGVVERRAVLH